MNWFFKILKQAHKVSKMEINVVEYQTSSMLESKRFAYTYAEETMHGQIKFDNDLSHQTLVLIKDKLEWYITKPLKQAQPNEN